jgi:hypothetical protein
VTEAARTEVEHVHSMWECGKMAHAYYPAHWMDEPCTVPEGSYGRCEFAPFRNTRLDLKPEATPADSLDAVRDRLRAAIGTTDASEGLPHFHEADGKTGVFVDRQAVLDVIDRVLR